MIDTITWYDLLQRLKQLDEVTLLEVLDLSAEEIVDRFEDIIDRDQDKLFDWFTEEEDIE